MTLAEENVPTLPEHLLSLPFFVQVFLAFWLMSIYIDRPCVLFSSVFVLEFGCKNCRPTFVLLPIFIFADSFENDIKYFQNVTYVRLVRYFRFEILHMSGEGS